MKNLRCHTCGEPAVAEHRYCPFCGHAHAIGPTWFATKLFIDPALPHDTVVLHQGRRVVVHVTGGTYSPSETPPQS